MAGGLNIMGNFGIGAGGPRAAGGGGVTVQEVSYGQEVAPTAGGVQSWHLAAGIATAATVGLVLLRWTLPRRGR